MVEFFLFPHWINAIWDTDPHCSLYCSICHLRIRCLSPQFCFRSKSFALTYSCTWFANEVVSRKALVPPVRMVGPTSDGSVINFLSLWCVGLLQIKLFSHQILHFLPQIVGLKDFSCFFKDFYSEKLQESYYWLYSVWNGTHSSFCKTLLKIFTERCWNVSTTARLSATFSVEVTCAFHKELYNYQG